MFQGKLISFTGTLEDFSKREADERAEKAGATVTDELTTQTDLLVVGHDPGKKLEVARRLSERKFIYFSFHFAPSPFYPCHGCDI